MLPRVNGSLFNQEGLAGLEVSLCQAPGLAGSLLSAEDPLEVMQRAVSRHGGEIGVCGSCMDARGITEAELVDGAHRGSMDQLTDWTQWADKVVTF